jgi:MoaA/NifB/PqqE/SkfB family radical SAM enzyme
MNDLLRNRITRRGFLGRLFSPAFDWIQVEVTSFCSANCTYCPHTVFRSAWSSRHLPIETFEKILSGASKTRLIHLQGWGEPFLNPNFFAMAEMAKKAGHQVGVTTNGMLLSDDMLSRLVEQQVDVVAFSLAGADEMNDTFRKGAPLETVLSAIRRLHRKKKENKCRFPAIHIAYLLLRSAVASLDKLPYLLDDAGVRQVVISTLDLVLTKEHERETLSPCTMSEYEALRAKLDAVSSEARRLDIDVHYQITYSGKRRPVCTENVLRALFISADGRVSPCVFTNLPIKDAPCATAEVEPTLQNVSFGNINESTLSEIWRTKAYALFRRAHRSGQFPPCRDCPKFYVI